MALRAMRENMKYLKWVLWLVIAAFVALFGSDWSGLNPNANPQVAAIVGGEPVKTDEVRIVYRNLDAYYRQVLGERYTDETARQLNVMGQALQQTVQRKILQREAHALGLAVTDAELREAILSNPLFQDDSGNFVGAEEYQQRLRRYYRTRIEDFEQELRRDLELLKLNDILRQTIYVSDREIEEIYRRQAEKAKIRYLQLPATKIGEVEVTEDEIAAYYESHKEDFALPERRVVDYILVDPLKLRGEIEIPEDELRAYYDDHQDEFTAEEQVLARHILLRVSPERSAEEAKATLADLKRRIENGEDFAQLARQYSEEPESAQRGGSLGFFGRNAWGEDFTEAVFGAEVGQLVGPVETQYGVHLIEVQDHRPGGLRPFEQVRAQIEARLLTDRANELAESRARELAQRLEGEDLTGEEAFKEAGAAAGYEVRTSPPFGREDAVPGIGRGLFPETAFGLQPGEVSELIKVPRGWAILRLKEIQPPRVPPVEEVADRIRPRVQLEKQKALVRSRLEEARARLEAGEITLDQLAAELGVEPQETPEFGAGGFIPGLGSNPEAVTAALAAAPGDVAGPFDTAQGAMVFEVVERKTFDPAELEAQRDALRTAEEQKRLDALQRSIIERRMRELDVRYVDQTLRDLGIEGDLAQG